MLTVSFGCFSEVQPCSATPLMEVKVECSCGTRYKFDVVPVNGLMPVAVNCPSCGADGTAAANAIIQQSSGNRPSGSEMIVPGGTATPSASAERPRIRLSVAPQDGSETS